MANFNPVFSLTPEVRVARITATTTDKTGDTTTNIVDLVTGDTAGTKVTWIKFKSEGNSTAGTALIWLTDTGDADNYLYAEQTYSAITSSATVASAETTFFFNDLQLKSGQKLKVGCTTATTSWAVTAGIGEFD
jgi:cytochrome c biogenesis factor